ncbi:hypothetical protein Aduo_005864 [Ancylostoma duodenale]
MIPNQQLASGSGFSRQTVSWCAHLSGGVDYLHVRDVCCPRGQQKMALAVMTDHGHPSPLLAQGATRKASISRSIPKRAPHTCGDSVPLDVGVVVAN